MTHYFFKITFITALCISLNGVGQDVNLFNGSLNYGAGLFAVPSSAGNAIPINLSYGGNGINVNQPSGEVGLGWGMSAGGSITRSTSGIPDDFNGNMFHQANRTFALQKGTLFGASSYDILTSTRNLDSLEFYYPNYDSYNVSGPGIGGSMTPQLLNFMAFKRNESTGEFNYDPTMSGPFVKPQFIFNGDFADTLVSRHYPNPTISTTPFHFPNDAISGDCYSTIPYVGRTAKTPDVLCSENYNPTTNRLGTANYIEYFSNAEIDAIGTTNIPGFIDFQATHTRPSANYPAQGIGAFRITNSAGVVYHYSLPVFANSSTNFTYPINNDYSLIPYAKSFAAPDAKIGTTDNYYVANIVSKTYGTGSVNDTTITEVKETARFATEWKLTAITGPDYVDVNNNHLVDNGDKGYWVAFDYKLWSNSFVTRYPTYGFNYYFGLDGKTTNYTLTDPFKRSGKYATASLNDAQSYYLNAVQTSTHKALFVRDIRNDEPSTSLLYDSGLEDLVKIDQAGTVQSSHGNMYDDGGLANYTGNTNQSFTKQISFGNPSTLVLNFRQMALSTSLSGSDNLAINTAPSVPLSFTYNSVVYTSPFTFANMPPINQEIVIPNVTYTNLTFIFSKLSGASNQGFNVEWHAIAKKTPQLLVKRVLLVDNTSTLPSLSAASTTNTNFDLSTTTNATSPCYNETWYQANKTAIDAVVLKGASFEYDYSLANNYYNNINCQAYSTSRLSSPSDVFQNLSVTTVTGGMGKLTLNKIINTELGNVQVTPSIKLDYNAVSSTDNPNYDPRKVDYWGYYKNDVSALGYSGYTTTYSKDYTDAWFLRKITSPMGGITEIEYESNSYNKVLTGKGGYRGAQRVFSFKDFDAGYNNLILEEGNTMTADLAEVYNATPPAGTTNDYLIPLVDDVTNNHSSTNTLNYLHATNIGYNATTPLPISFDISSMYPTTRYSGNGWLRFNLPVGYAVYGAGSRVRKITTRNGTKDAYVTLYEYENGVALNEADRFSNPRQRYVQTPTALEFRYEKLQSFGGDKYGLAPTIGYTKVTTKNLGQINTAKGWTETYFNTSDALTTTTYIDNFKVNLSNRSNQSVPCVDAYPLACTSVKNASVKVVEYSDKFSPYWGLSTENRVYDVNSNMLNRSINEYETTQQGALVENFMFRVQNVPTNFSPGELLVCHCNDSIPYYQVCIKRQYPAVLKRTTSYGMGTKTVSQTLSRDELTGEATVSQTTSENNTSALIIKKPAFRIAAFANMGPKSVNAAWDNILGGDAYNYSVIDSTLTGTAGQPSSNFAGAGVTVFSKSVNVRSFNTSTGAYINTGSTLPNWYSKASFAWSGDVGSLDTYGLYKKSELAANPFNFASPYTSNSKWRFGSEISLMDAYGHTIETRSFNNKFSATKMDATGKYLLSQITNCNFLSFTYSGFEFSNTVSGGATNYDGELNIPTATSSIYTPATGYAVQPHTGINVARVIAGAGPNYSVAFNGLGTYGEELGLLRDRIYRASVWVHNTSDATANITINLNGTAGTVINQTVSMYITDAKAVTVGNWKLLYVDIKVPANYTSTGGTTNNLTASLQTTNGTAWFDDFQLHPIETQTTAKVYEPITGRITADISADGYATKYVYDAAGRIIYTYKEIPNIGLKLIKHNTYNYGRGIN